MPCPERVYNQDPRPWNGGARGQSPPIPVPARSDWKSQAMQWKLYREGHGLCLWRWVHAGAVCGLLAAGCMPSYQSRLQAYRQAGDLESARQLLEEAGAVAPGSAAIQREQGVVAVEQGRYAEAVPHLEESLALDPTDARASFYLALALDALDRVDEAAERYEAARVQGGYSGRLDGALVRAEHRVHAERVRRRVAAAMEGVAGEPGRVLFLPFDLQTRSPAARAFRLSTAALMIDEWRRVPGAAPVPLDELMAFLDAMEVERDADLGRDERRRLAQLTGAGMVVSGRLSEFAGDLGLHCRVEEFSGDQRQVVPFELLRGRGPGILDHLQTIVFRVAQLSEVELTEAGFERLRKRPTDSALAVRLYGEALAHWGAGREAEARRAVEEALADDDAFELARRLALILEEENLVASGPGRVEGLRRLFEATALERQRLALRDELLAAHSGGEVVAGDGGESGDLSVNQPTRGGGASVTVRLPR